MRLSFGIKPVSRVIFILTMEKIISLNLLQKVMSRPCVSSSKGQGWKGFKNVFIAFGTCRPALPVTTTLLTRRAPRSAPSRKRWRCLWWPGTMWRWPRCPPPRRTWQKASNNHTIRYKMESDSLFLFVGRSHGKPCLIFPLTL
jgi:hypothetical protein